MEARSLNSGQVKAISNDVEIMTKKETNVYQRSAADESDEGDLVVEGSSPGNRTKERLPDKLPLKYDPAKTYTLERDNVEPTYIDNEIESKSKTR